MVEMSVTDPDFTAMGSFHLLVTDLVATHAFRQAIQVLGRKLQQPSSCR